uniref:Uncharacterized protein LOC105035666 isoform X5 n=1 Tax=Elaeis guineensis var. tenera TaxID=51953 RepID=A0A8N4I6E2_ELAGV|nr:uncharacterized protein LOC105035666 isoform X5 [Elaeis guineensis]
MGQGLFWMQAYRFLHICFNDGPRQTASTHFSHLTSLCHLKVVSKAVSDEQCSVVGIHVLEAPVLHPMAEGLFNFVIGWTLLFAPLLFTDCQRDRYKGSLDLLWGFQMFLTNTFLIPYMAMRLNDIDVKHSPSKQSQLGLLMTNGASFVGIAGGTVCLISTLWTIFGRSNMGFGGIADRWEFLERYVGSERLAYAFIWDICLYAIFQPWLIGDNLQNVKKNNEQIVRNLRFIPVVGLVAYLLSLDKENVL